MLGAPDASDDSQSEPDPGHESRVGLEAVLARGPPQDLLGRMLFFLAQAPPALDQLQLQPQLGRPGDCRWVVRVDMSAVSA